MTVLELLVPFAGGLLLSGVYFAALWWTVRRVARSPRPFALLGASLLVRMAVLLGGFYVLMQGRWERLLACAVAFLIVRTVCVSQMKTALAEPRTPGQA